MNQGVGEKLHPRRGLSRTKRGNKLRGLYDINVKIFLLYSFKDFLGKRN